MTPSPPTGAEELFARIGAKLRAAREAKNLTIQEVSSYTRINSIFLEKIETGDLSTLPGLIFVRGFIRNYLQVLDLKDASIEADLERIAGLKEYEAETSLEPSYSEGETVGGRKLSPAQKSVIGGLAVAVVLFGGYLLVRSLAGSGPVRSPVVVQEDSASGEAGAGAAESGDASGQPGAPPERAAAPDGPAAPEGARPDAAPARQTAVTPASAAAVGAPQNLRLTIRGLEPTWLRISVDRAPPFEVRVEPAETMNWDANEEIRLSIGKSQGVAVYLNGEDILLPAERDQLIPSIVLNKLTLLRLEN